MISAALPCEWPGCPKQVRPTGARFICQPHRDLENKTFVALIRLEGPASLNRPTPTVAEIAEFAQTGVVPASRQAAMTHETTRMSCADCGGPLLMLNNADWVPGAKATRPDGSAWGIGVCRCCSFDGCPHKEVAMSNSTQRRDDWLEHIQFIRGSIAAVERELACRPQHADFLRRQIVTLHDALKRAQVEAKN